MLAIEEADLRARGNDDVVKQIDRHVEVLETSQDVDGIGDATALGETELQDVLLRPHTTNELPSIAGGGALSVGSADGSANAGAGAGGRPTTGPTIGS